MSAIQLLVVDDSAVVRQFLREVFEDAPDLEIAGFARDGEEALERVRSGDIDVLILDILMPNMDGLETLQSLGELDADPGVLVFSSATERGAPETVSCLLNGADGYITKPDDDFESRSAALRAVRSNMLARVRALADRAPSAGGGDEGEIDGEREADLDATVRASSPPSDGAAGGPIRGIGIAVSTGGPSLLKSLLSELPPDLAAPIFVVQHIPPSFAESLVERLDEVSPLAVRAGRDGDRARPGTVWFAPGDRHLGVRRSGDRVEVELSDGPKRNACRPSADVLFRSLAETFGSGCLGAVLTGMGVDGLEGCRAIAEHGGHILVQDEQSSAAWSMPRRPHEEGLAHEVLSADELPERIRSLVASSGG